VATDVLILFRFGETTVTRDARVQLSFLSKLMHQYPESSYTITGYADSSTGNRTVSNRLSSERARKTKEFLVKEFGVPASRLNTASVGGVDSQSYNDPSFSRSVVIRPDKY
jgi:outer membrane protein OmpA-like peptidoglycan-associated protein